MTKLRLNFACWDYDRTRSLQEGLVQAKGIDLNYIALPPEDIFHRMLKHREFEAAEMSLSSYVLSTLGADANFVAIPAFPSRTFRHSCIYVNKNSGIESPADLVGKKVGCPEYQMTATVWIRGMLADLYGVPVDSVDYFTGGQEQAGRQEKLPLNLSRNIRVKAIDQNKTLSAMLQAGEIDALYTARPPSSFAGGKGTVRRLFEDYGSAERDYFKKSGIFPIMHTVVLRKDIYQANPWAASSLMQALELSKTHAYGQLEETAALKVMLPHLASDLGSLRQVMGDDYWPYGISKNRHVLETFLRYFEDQGLSASRLDLESLFAKESLSEAKI